MKTRTHIAGPAFLLMMAIVLAAGGTLARQGAASGKEQRKEQKEDAAGFKDFMDRVQEYVNLHKTVEATLPTLKPKEELPEVITAHQQALARKIREARLNAKPHDIFTKPSHDAFRHAIRSTFHGPEANHALATVRQGDPVKEVHLKVNQVYPEGVPHTTVPPTLLQKFPKLPDEVEYRIVGRDLILIDVRANMVVDLLKEILP